MAMNVKPVPTLDDEVNEIRLATAEIVNKHILPVEDKLWGCAFRQRKRAERSRQGGEGTAQPDSGHREEGEAVGAAPAARIRRHGSHVHAARVHERSAVLQPRRRVAVRRRRAELRQPEHPRQIRHAAAAREMAEAADRRADAVRLLDDRTAQPRFRSALADDQGRARRRRVGHQRPQVVHVERLRGRLLHRHVPHVRSERHDRRATTR